MNLLDLYENREPYQQAIDRLEQARIAHLKEKMDDYAKHKNAKGFKAAKKELDSYYKIKDECMGYGSLGEADQVPAPTQPVRAGTDLVTPQQRVAGATPPSNTVVGKAKSTFSSFVDWLAGRDDTGPTYESTVKEQTSAASPVTAAKYAYEQMRKAFEDNVDIATIRWMNSATPVTMSRNQLFHTLAKLKGMSRQNRNQFALQTLANRENFYLWLGSQKKIAPRPALKQPKDPFQPELPLNKPTPGIPSQSTPVQERAQKKNSKGPKFGDTETANTVRKIRAKYPAARSDVEALAKDEIANQEKTNKTISDLEAVNARQDAALKQARALDSQQGNDLDNVEQQIDQLSQRLQLIKTAKPVAGRPTSNAPKITKQPAKTEPKTTEPISVPVAAVNPGLEKKIDDLNKQIKNLPKGADPQVENDLQAKLARAEELLKNYSQRIAAAQAQKQSDVLSPSDQAQQQLAKATQKSASQPQTIPRSLNLKTRAPSGDRDLKPTFKAKTKTKTTPLKATPVPEPEDEFDLLNIDESANKLHAGDPIVVTAPNWYDDELDEGSMSELDIERQDLDHMTDPQFLKAYGISKEFWKYKNQALLKKPRRRPMSAQLARSPVIQKMNTMYGSNCPGCGRSTNPDRCICESVMKEGWSDAYVARRTGRPRTPYSVYIKGKKWKDFENDDHARAVADKLKAKFKAAGRDPETITIAPTDIPKGVAEAQTDYQKRRQRERDVDAGRPVKPVPKNPQTDYARKRAQDRKDMELGEGADLINMSDLQFYKELLGVMVIPVAAFGAMAWNKAMNAIKLYRAEDVITALQKKGVTVDRSTLEQIKPLLLKLEQAIDVDKDGDVAKELAKRIQQTVTWGKLKQANPRTDVRTTDTELGEMHEPQKYIVTINGKATGPLYADMADRLYTAAKRAQPNARIEKTAAPTAQRQKGIDRVKAGYGDEDALELHEQLPSTPPANRKEYLDQRDKLFRMMAVDSNPANKQIIKQAIKDLDARYGLAKDPIKEESSTSSEAVEIAIIRRVLVAHVDLIMEFGLDKVTQAIEEVAYNVGDVDEIGTSDVSAWVNQVRQILGAE